MLGSLSFIAAVPKHFGTRDCFHGRQFLHGPEPGDDLGMIRAHYIDCALCMHAKSLQSCPTLCNPVDYSPPGSSVHGIQCQVDLTPLLGWLPPGWCTDSHSLISPHLTCSFRPRAGGLSH